MYVRKKNIVLTFLNIISDTQILIRGVIKKITKIHIFNSTMIIVYFGFGKSIKTI